MNPVKQQFLELAIKRNALKFGEFTLKSGRLSPYFFNAGLFSSGGDLAILGDCYASTIKSDQISFDMLFGPAYKGIPLATAAATALYRGHQRDVPVCFNRKEAKTHGEGGNLIGAALKGNVLIIDDVITAGTAIRESIEIITAQGANPAGVLVALDRQEKGKGELSAIQEVEKEFNIPVFSIVNLADLAEFIGNNPELQQQAEAIANYRKQYGIAS